MTPTTDIVQKLWNLCHVVRDNESLRYQTSPCIPSRSQKCAKFVTLRSFETGANCLASTPKHRKFAKGNRVVIAEAGSIHKGETGKIIFTSYGSQEDEYRIALDKESHFVREVTIKIPKPCGLTYLIASRSSSKP
jgi:hypothetical protein